DGCRPAEGAPLQHERAMTRVGGGDGDGELLDRGGDGLCNQRSPAKVERRVVFGTPLSDLLVHDQLGARFARHGPERVRAFGEAKAPERDRRRGRELRRRVRSGAPYVVDWNDIAEQHAPAGAWA